MIISVFNNKGGVGKTTSAVNIAAALAGAGNRVQSRVLLVDLDAQGSASLSLGVPRVELARSIALPLYGEAAVASVIRPTSLPGLDLVPGDMRLANADLVLSGEQGREKRLAAILAPLRTRYDWIILDAPPSLSLLSLNALTAAAGVIVPVAPEYLALEGLVNVLEAMEQIRASIGLSAEMLGILLTRVDYRTCAAIEIADMVRGRFGAQVFTAEVRGNVALTEAPSFGQTIFEYAPRSRGADDYRAVAQEIISRVHNSQRRSAKKAPRRKGT